MAQCQRCNRLIHTSKERLLNTSTGIEMWCDDCVEQYAYYCEYCGQYCSDDMPPIDEGNFFKCPNCQLGDEMKYRNDINYVKSRVGGVRAMLLDVQLYMQSAYEDHRENHDEVKLKAILDLLYVAGDDLLKAIKMLK